MTTISSSKTLSLNLIDNSGIDRLIIVPREPGDVTGHIDGMIRFIDKERIIVGSYPASYTKGKDNISEVKLEEGKAFSKYLIDKLSKSFEVIRVQNSIPRKGPYEFPGAFGNYINFLRIGSKVILPQYNIPEDEPAKEQFRKCFKDSDIKLLNKDVDLLSYYGGVINCISCQIY
ncbi:MAG: agmatine deiminase family protein [Bacteroidota bacterium]|nr:agmatine deiminase family protein [Bacteroidota bacterium]